MLRKVPSWLSADRKWEEKREDTVGSQADSGATGPLAYQLGDPGRVPQPP